MGIRVFNDVSVVQEREDDLPSAVWTAKRLCLRTPDQCPFLTAAAICQLYLVAVAVVLTKRKR